MTDNGKVAGLNRRKLIPAIVIVIIIVVLSSIFYLNILQSESKKNDIEEFDQIQFTIDIVDTPYEFNLSHNKSIYWQLKNISDKDLNYTTPSIGKNLDFYLTAPNGTVYQYAGPMNFDLLYSENLSPGEIDSGYIWFGFEISSSPSGENYTYWQNWTTEEYWSFKPGTYEIYGKYESYAPHSSNIKDGIIGIWKSNVTIFTIN